MFRHILPNAMVAMLTFLPFNLCGSITTLTLLAFSVLSADRPALSHVVIRQLQLLILDEPTYSLNTSV